MLSLREYRNKAERLADFLPWAALIASGVVLNKDGSFQRTARFRGPDLDSATPAELVATTARLNSVLRRLGSGWALFAEAVRRPAQEYPACDFPDPASALVERERAAQFAEEGAHFESRYFLTLLWMPPAEDAARAESWLYEGKAQKGVDPRELLDGFIDRTERLLRLFEGFFPEAQWLDDGATLTYLHSCVSTPMQQVRVPETPMYLDALLADEPLCGGLEPRLGAAHLRTLTVVGFPSATFPGLLDDLNAQGFAYRWSTRAIMLDKSDANKLLGKIRRQWFAKRKSVAAILKEVMTNEASVLVDSDAANKAEDADAALQELGSDHVGLALVTATVTVWDEDASLAAEKLRLAEKVIQGRDFTLLIIDEGWLVLDSPAFAAQLREWLKTLRKKNASVVFATQSLADIETSAIAPAIIESCPTRIFLPNERAMEPQIQAIYRRFGLNDRQIEILSQAAPKRDYYCQSARGNRLFELGLGEVALAFTAASSKSDQLAIARIAENERREGFPEAWLRHRGLDWAAELLAIPEPNSAFSTPRMKETSHDLS